MGETVTIGAGRGGGVRVVMGAAQDTVEPGVITEGGGEGAGKPFWLRILREHLKDFPAGPVVKMPRFHRRGARVPSLVRELRSHLPRGEAKKKKKKKITLISF